jgi:hypothetical protein
MGRQPGGSASQLSTAEECGSRSGLDARMDVPLRSPQAAELALQVMYSFSLWHYDLVTRHSR